MAEYMISNDEKIRQLKMESRRIYEELSELQDYWHDGDPEAWEREERLSDAYRALWRDIRRLEGTDNG